MNLALVLALLWIVDVLGTRPTFLQKAQECETQCEGRRQALPECDLFCIDESCYTRVFGTLDVTSRPNDAALDDPKKVEAFTRCAKLRLLPAIPAAMRSKTALKEEQKRAMDAWQQRMDEHRKQRLSDRTREFEQQKEQRRALDLRKQQKRNLQRNNHDEL